MSPAASVVLRAALCRLTIAFVLTAAPAARAAPTLTIDFDHGIRALDRRGQPVATEVVGKLVVVDSDAGTALRSGPGYGYLQLPSAGILSAHEGTVELWVAPVDWSGSEQKFHVFFQAQGEGGALFLYKYYLGNLLMLTCQDSRAGPYASAGADSSGWQPGQWHHVAGSWSARHVRLYVDGKRVAEAPPLLPLALASTFVVGDHPGHLARTSSSRPSSACSTSAAPCARPRARRFTERRRWGGSRWRGCRRRATSCRRALRCAAVP
jgi:hypothetical protein